MIKGKSNIYSGSYSLAFTLYSKKDGIGYLSPLGLQDEGSEIFLSILGCLLLTCKAGRPNICDAWLFSLSVVIFDIGIK